MVRAISSNHVEKFFVCNQRTYVDACSSHLNNGNYKNLCYTVKLGIKEMLNKEKIGFKELFTDY